MAKKNTGERRSSDELWDGYQDKLAKTLTSQMEFYDDKFNRRQTYEWKFCLAMWTAIAVFIALIVKGDITLVSSAGGSCAWILFFVLFFVASGSLILLQWYFLSNLKRSNDADRAKAEVFRKKLRRNVFKDLGLNWKKADRVYRMSRKKGRKGWYATCAEIGITVTLILCAFFLVLIKTQSTNDTLGEEYSVQMVGGTYVVKQEEDQYAISNWDANCPLPPVFRFQLQDISNYVMGKDRDKQAAIRALLEAMAKDNDR